MTNTIVVLGGAYAGVQISHRLLKYTKPQVKDLKVILVSKNNHFFWNMASVRAIVPGVLKEEQYSQEITPGFAKYPSDAFEFVSGTAEALDTETKTVKVSTTSGEERSISYDQLVLATGTRCVDTNVPWKNNGSYEELRAMMAETQDKVKAAKHIVVAGAGATGVETAAELAFEFKGSKEVVLLSGDGSILGGDSVASSAMAELKKLGVTVQNNARVETASTNAEGKTEIVLKSGETIVTDLYLPTMGMKPNSEYVPENLLTEHKYVEVDEFYKVKGAENIWAAGDIVSKPKATYVLTDKQASGVAKNIDAVLKGKKPTVVKLLPIDVLMLATGRSRGAGRMGSVKAFSIMVYMIKGKTLGTEKLLAYVDGSQF
ncbi:FAD/NAD(P)-binding domain-containing protein [Xylariaceae sp. FL0016]|nr:FAD/NAD(P)-binding domain-containing protein [Xylariaceae sp. FL0016]